MNNKPLVIFIFFLHVFQYINSQSNYEKGYIISSNKDTINGYILNKIDSQLANEISFKKNISNTTITKYSSNELYGFGFNSGRIFKRLRIGTTNQNPQDSSFIFAKRIVKGKIDLFIWRHKENDSKDFFVINNESLKKSILSKPKKKEIKLDDKTYNETSYTFVDNLQYVKNDLNDKSKKNNKLNFGEKSISKNVIEYNTNFITEYPILKYKEPFKHNYTILTGIPFNLNSKELHFRVGLYRDKRFIEKTNTFSYISGLIYQHWNSKENNLDYQHSNSEQNYRWQMLNIIPFGIKIQTNSKQIIPYGYLGVGAGLLLMSDHIIKNYQSVGNNKETVLLPTVNTGVGLKIKVKTNFIITEVTPTMNGFFFNMGYSF
jgi:hypothetical protein